jgi:hypothetical protein
MLKSILVTAALVAGTVGLAPAAQADTSPYNNTWAPGVVTTKAYPVFRYRHGHQQFKRCLLVTIHTAYRNEVYRGPCGKWHRTAGPWLPWSA